LNGSSLTFEKRGVVSDQNYLRNVFDLLALMAGRVDPASGPEPMPLTPSTPPAVDLSLRRMLTPQQAIEMFAERKRIQRIAGIITFSFFLLLIVYWYVTHWHSFEMPGPMLTIVSGLIFIVFLVLSIFILRCPVCNKYTGATANQTSCQKCGTRLV
jgi:hypothetical protein